MIEVTVNGTPRTVPEGVSIAWLLRELGISVAQVAVEVNRQLVPRGEHARRTVRQGDQLEVVTLVGGG